MISISVDVEGMRLTAEGHAGYAPHGQDIICAGVSALVCTLAHNISLHLHPDEYTVQMQDGSAYIEAHPPDAATELCRGFFMTIANGLIALADQHSQYIQIESE